MRCDECRFWDVITYGGIRRGLCRIRSVAIFPVRIGDEWCGEHKAAEGRVPRDEFCKTMSARTANCLDKAGIESIAGLVQWSVEDLAELRHVSETTVNEIKELLATQSRSLSDVDHSTYPRCRWDRQKQQWDKA